MSEGSGSKNSSSAIMGIQSTAGAIPVLNEKGELSMQKVKVHRYVSGKRPEYAPESSSEEESDEEFQVGRAPGSPSPPSPTPEMIREQEKLDPRLRRLQLLKADDNVEERKERHRYIHEPEVIEEEEEEEEEEAQVIEEPMNETIVQSLPDDEKVKIKVEPCESDGKHYNFDLRSDDDEPAEELDEDEIERRRRALREKALMRKEEELLGLEDEGKGSMDEETEEESSEYEEYSDSEEDTGPRLKPVFVRKKDRVTIQEKEKEALKQKQIEIEMKKFAEERRKQTLKMVEDDAKKEIEKMKAVSVNPDEVNTDDENDEAEYESWKIRELKRIKRDKEERETFERERLEVERLRNMTEEERRLELRNNPKEVTNKAIKGKYKFLQKYYHRGAFYLDEEDEVFKRDFSAATLEDHFDKTILPKVMQVKNFGRSGRTKYTHLVDQDTTHFDSPWVSESSMNLKFSSSQAGGMKQVFNRPTKKRTS